jgi:F-type H+-transporting ATPase subunit b
MSLLSVSTLLDTTLADSALSEGSAVNVDLDASLFVQVGLFVVLLLVLKPLLFEPMLKLFEAREEQIEGMRAKAREIDKENVIALTKYEAILTKAREAGAADRDALRAEGARKEAELMARVRASAAQTIERGRAATADDAKAARASLKAEAKVLGRAIAARAVGREVSP